MPAKNIEIVDGWPTPHSLDKRKLANIIMAIQCVCSGAMTRASLILRKSGGHGELEAIAKILIDEKLAP